MISHIAGAIAMFISGGGLGWVVPLIIFLMKKDQSRFVAYHAMQALAFEGVIFLTMMVLVLIGTVTCGIGFIITLPLMIVVGIAALVYHIKAGMAANEGQWYELPVAGRFARKQLGV